MDRRIVEHARSLKRLPFDFNDHELEQLAKIAFDLDAEMVTEIPLGLYPWTAGASLASSQYLWATTDSSGHVVVNTTSGGDCLGIIQNAPASGDAVSVQSYGISKAICGAAISLAAGGAPVMSDGAGKTIAATSTNHILGYVFDVNATTATGQYTSVLIVHAGKM